MADRWDIFCRVIDNYGDIGVCWRLARQLHYELGIRVRLWVDRLEVLTHLCPQVQMNQGCQQVDGIEICQWESCSEETLTARVVIEAFACEIPSCYQRSLLSLHESEPNPPVVWINLEYLSAEDWVSECHGLATPGSSTSLRKYFFFPGFTTETGGLLKEAGLREQVRRYQQEFTSQVSQATPELWARLVGKSGDNPLPESHEMPGELRVSLFCYLNPLIPQLLDYWSSRSAPTSLFVTQGLATNQVAEWCGHPLKAGDRLQIGALELLILPFLPPPAYDELLWSCDFNFVRGEDSFVRAQWANRPLIWQIYPQEDSAHHKKLEAFLSLYLRGICNLEAVSEFWRLWNHIPPDRSWAHASGIEDAWEKLLHFRQEWNRHSQEWADRLDRKGNLANNLQMFVRKIREETSRS
ncbi:hypothetical protein Spb1_27210 [Planctopirus ephydatiae]|uniref:Protein-arginine rhamnosyltransferase n=1 Tax=Planctopirus ephydatiae TaxID=2528019 RepID=A0A518GQA4_9PLAN|nr:elongation factor P maturation arginine rhamnosyltransferase EarP [Planctopirus ephydatiae]QDV30786.1 hypothetical protein Spb1_27210 [Planctopirus ephydatiae]